MYYLSVTDLCVTKDCITAGKYYVMYINTTLSFSLTPKENAIVQIHLYYVQKI